MKIYIDRDKVNSRATLANAASVGGMLLLLASVLAPLFISGLARFALVFLFVGGATSMTGIYLANRWVRKPRPEDSLDKALKPFDDNYRLYHYPDSPSDHVLLTPTGVVAMEVVNLAGTFAHRKGRWKESMTMGRALRYLVEPRVGDPILLEHALSGELQRWFRDNLKTGFNVPVRVLTVFTHPAVQLELDDGSVPALMVGKLRKQVASQGARLAQSVYDDLAACLERVTVG
jgi:hypothetical protein